MRFGKSMNDWTTTKIPVRGCPYCGYLFYQASTLEGGSPQPGDLLLCLRCAQWLTFTGNLKIRPLTAQEERQLPEKARLYQRAMKEVDRSQVGREQLRLSAAKSRERPAAAPRARPQRSSRHHRGAGR